jgi:hypothetical protein
MNIAEKTTFAVAYSFMSATIICMLVITYWLFYPYVPLIIEKPIKIMNPNKTVVAGEYLVYSIEYDKKLPVEGVLTRKLLNDYIIDMRSSVSNSRLGKDERLVHLQIPHYAAPGKYTLWWSVTYKMNPVRHVTVSVESEPFTIVAKGN